MQTLRDRWALFVGALLSVTLGVALVQSSAVLLAAAATTHPRATASPQEVLAVRETVDGVSSLMGLSILVAIFLSVFIIGSTLAFTVAERRRDLALLRLSGASRRQLRRLVVGEGLVVGLAGTGLGALLGLVVTGVESWLVARVGMQVTMLQIAFPPWVLLIDLAAGLGSALAGVLVAARRAGRIAPLDALRETEDGRRVMTLGRWAWAFLLGVPTMVGVMLAQASGDPMVSIVVGLGVILAGSIAVQQLSPLVVPVMARSLTWPARRHVLGELAQAGIRDGVRRSATTAGPVIVLFALVVGLLGILGTQAEATRIERLQQSSAQLVVVSEGDVTAEIRATEGVAVASPESDVALPVRIPRRHGGWSRVQKPLVNAVDPAAYRQLTSMEVIAGRLAEFRRGTAVLGPAAPEDGFGHPSTVRVARHELPVAARLASTIAGGADVLVDRRDVPQDALAHATTTTFVRVTNRASVFDVQARLASLGSVSTVPGWASDLKDQETREDNDVMAALAGLGALYAFLSLVNAVAVGTSQRRREFAVARVSGASRIQVLEAAAIESSVVAGVGIALGAVVVATCLVGVRHAIMRSLGVAVVVVPWQIAVGLAVAAILTSAVTAVVAASAATRARPIRLVAASE